jgi:hypothetical protein
MPQTPDSDTIMHCLDRAQAIHGPRIAAMLADGLTDAWTRSIDQGPNAALLASGWLSVRALHWRKINPPVAAFFDRLAELSAGAWADEIDIATTDIPDYPPDDLGSVDLPEPTGTPDHDDTPGAPMSIFARKTDLATAVELEPSPDVARRIAEAKADDIASYAESGGDLDAWPHGWNDPSSDSYVRPAVREFYHRDRGEDVQIVEQMRERVRKESGFAARVTREEAQRVTHAQALRRAEALHKQAQDRAREARLDRTQRRCDICGTIADHSVRPRPSSTWRLRQDCGHGVGELALPFAPHACDPCAPLVERELDALLAVRAAEHEHDDTPNGARIDAVRAYVEQRAQSLSFQRSSTERPIR